MILPHPSVLFRASAGSFAALICLTCATALAADPGSGAVAKPNAPKTHVLYMGADISVQIDKKYVPVEKVTLKDLVVQPDGKPVLLPLTQAADLQINETLKLTDVSVAINALNAERAYSVGADPLQAMAKAASLAAGQQAEIDAASGAALTLRMQQLPGGGGAAAIEDRVVDMYNTLPSQVYDTVDNSVKANPVEPMYDSIRLNFELAPQNDLAEPYFAVIALIRDYGSKPGQARKWAYVQAVEPIRAGEVRRVLVYRSGFPPGFVLESCEVHVYDRGEELATNVSRKRVPLTDDEAFEYRVIEHISINKGKTVPAALASRTFAGDKRFALTKAQLDQTHYVRVTAMGSVAETFRDAAGKQPLEEPTLVAALQTLRFKPALTAGKPVESIAPVKLSQLSTH